MICVGFRLDTRIRLTKSAGADDWLCLLSLVRFAMLSSAELDAATDIETNYLLVYLFEWLYRKYRWWVGFLDPFLA